MQRNIASPAREQTEKMLNWRREHLGLLKEEGTYEEKKILSLEVHSKGKNRLERDIRLLAELKGSPTYAKARKTDLPAEGDSKDP